MRNTNQLTLQALLMAERSIGQRTDLQPVQVDGQYVLKVANACLVLEDITNAEVQIGVPEATAQQRVKMLLCAVQMFNNAPVPLPSDSENG